MPIYEYECRSCNERTEILQKVTDAPLSHCPACGGEMRKLISSPAIQFKGSGFYLTDYGRSGSTRSGSSEGSSTKDAGSDSSKSTKADTSSSTE